VRRLLQVNGGIVVKDGGKCFISEYHLCPLKK